MIKFFHNSEQELDLALLIRKFYLQHYMILNNLHISKALGYL
ncbi:hypothetical protein RINTHM_13630 [Richelia intracellularis HM01]|nr:hypothetical protein RINTHM_13630 [Richelia intracellularis HM01]